MYENKVTPEFVKFMDIILYGDIDWMVYNVKNTVIMGLMNPSSLPLAIKYADLFPDLMYAQQMGTTAYNETIQYFHTLLNGTQKAKLSLLTKSTMLIVLDWWPEFGDFYRDMINTTPELDTEGFKTAVNKMEEYLELGYNLIKNAETFQ